MRFIHYHQIPTGGNQILEPAAVYSATRSAVQPRRLSMGLTESKEGHLIEHRLGRAPVVHSWPQSLQCADVVA